MPIQKFKSIDDAKRALWNFNPDAKYYAHVKDFFEMISKLMPPKSVKRGIYKYKSIKDLP